MSRRYPKRSRLKYTKKPYRVQNWPVYETALRRRGELRSGSATTPSRPGMRLPALTPSPVVSGSTPTWLLRRH